MLTAMKVIAVVLLIAAVMWLEEHYSKEKTDDD